MNNCTTCKGRGLIGLLTSLRCEACNGTGKAASPVQGAAALDNVACGDPVQAAIAKWDSMPSAVEVLAKRQGAASASFAPDFNASCTVTEAATSSASGAKGAAVKRWEEQYESDPWGPRPLLSVRREAYKDAEIADWRALADRSPAVQQVAGQAVNVQSIMHEVFQYARLSEGIDQAEGEKRAYQREAMAQQDRKIRGMIAGLATPAPEQPSLTPMQALGEALKLACPPLNHGEWATFEAAIRKDSEQQTVHTIGFVRGAQAAQPSGAAKNLRITKLPARYASEQEEQAIQRVNDAARKHIARVSSSTPAPEQEAAQVAPPGAREARPVFQVSSGHQVWVDVGRERYDECAADTHFERRTLYAAPATDIIMEAAQFQVLEFNAKQGGFDSALHAVLTALTAPVPAATPAEQPEGDSSHVLPPFAAPAGQHDAGAPAKVEITREGGCFWHTNCTNHFGGIMREAERGADKSLFTCLSCGKSAHYPVGGAGTVCADEVARATATNTNQPEGAAGEQA